MIIETRPLITSLRRRRRVGNRREDLDALKTPRSLNPDPAIGPIACLNRWPQMRLPPAAWFRQRGNEFAHRARVSVAASEATRARGARKIKIINFGLEPWEAQAMGLGVEDLEEKDKRKPVADYVVDYDRERGTDWAEWLQTHRTELNAMTTPQLIAWLDGKDYDKLIPPDPVLAAELEANLEERVREQVQERA